MKELKRQDKNGVRHASDIERKYKLGTINYTAEEIEKLKMQIIVDSSLSTSSVHPVQNKVITEALNNKVNREEGKKLSSNDYTDEEKNKLANVDLTAIDNKVDKEEGKGLSSNNYTDAEKNKLAELKNYTLPTASSTTLGGIKVGAGLSINNGFLSATGGGTADSVDWSNVINKPTKVSEFENDADYTTTSSVNTAISTAIQNLVTTETHEADLTNKVDKVEGKGLSTNDFTNTLLNKLNNIENNAEANVIESISVNGVDQNVSNKKVSIEIEEYTDKDQVQANTAARHTHSNKSLLDTYTQTEANLAEAVANKHTHSNKTVLDGISSTLVDSWNSVIESNPESKSNKVTSIDSTSTDTQYPSAKAVYNALQQTEGATAFYKEYKSTYITTENNTTIVPINISQYRSEIDLLTVYINGFQLIEGMDYTKTTNSITLTKAIDADNVVHFVILRSIATKTENYDLLRGEAGLGVPAGGKTGQILAKISDDDNNTEWIDAPSGTTTNVVDNLESTSAIDALSANQGRLLKEEINNFSSKTTIYEGALMGGSSVVLSNVKRYLEVHFLIRFEPGVQYAKYTIDTKIDIDLPVSSGCVVPAFDESSGYFYYISDSSFNKVTNTFTHSKTGYFSINTRAFTNRNNSTIYYVYKIETYD